MAFKQSYLKVGLHTKRPAASNPSSLKAHIEIFLLRIEMYVQKFTVMRFLQLKVAGHSLKLGCGSLFIGMLFKICCRYKAQIWHRKNMFIGHDIC